MPLLAQMPDDVYFTQVTAGRSHSCALDTDGQAWCWGSQTSGRLGDGVADLTSTPVPQAVLQPAGVIFTQISAGGFHTCAIDSGGQCWCWGGNSHGQLGSGTTSNASTPMAVSTGTGMSSIIHVDAGNMHTCAVDVTGNTWCWGDGSYGKLGTGLYQDVLEPALITEVGAGFAQAQMVSAGLEFTCMLDVSGHVWCWGANQCGQLGRGTFSASEASIVQVDTESNDATVFVKLHVSEYGMHACAVGVDGTGWCWGRNAGGELGLWDGDLSDRASPCPVSMPAGGILFEDITTGNSHSCAVGNNGRAYCWGTNGQGQLGDETLLTGYAPTVVHDPVP